MISFQEKNYTHLPIYCILFHFIFSSETGTAVKEGKETFRDKPRRQWRKTYGVSGLRFSFTGRYDLFVYSFKNYLAAPAICQLNDNPEGRMGEINNHTSTYKSMTLKKGTGNLVRESGDIYSRMYHVKCRRVVLDK